VKDLLLVLSLAATGTTQRASERLHLTQSAVSRALAQAETRAGVRLFDRSARGLSATLAGQRLLAGAGVILNQLRDLERSVRDERRAALRVRLVCECYTAYRWLPSALKALASRMPNLEVEIAVEHTRAATEALLHGAVDVALLTTGIIPKRSGLLERPLFSDEVVFLVGTTHALAKEKSLTPGDLRNHALITANTPAAEQSWFLRQTFGRQRPKLRSLRFPVTEAIIDAARAGLGIAVLSEWIATPYLESSDLVLKRLKAGPLLRPWRIAYRPEARDAAETLGTLLVGSAPRRHDR